MVNPLQQPLPGPWGPAGRVLGAHRPEPGEPPGVPHDVRTAARGLPCVMLERAVAAGAGTGREALGGPELPLAPLLDGLPPAWVVLTHGGPRCADVQRDRPVAAATVRDPVTGRTPQALDGAGWEAVLAAFAAAARAAVAAGAWALGVEAARGHLWHAAISPLLCADAALAARGAERLAALVRELSALCPRVSVSLCVEDLAPLGLHPGISLAVAQRLAGAGATMVVARTGSPWFLPRMHPAEPRRAEEEAPSLHAARWLRGSLPEGVAVALAGAVRSRGVAEAAVAAGGCDVVVVGRPLRQGRVLAP